MISEKYCRKEIEEYFLAKYFNNEQINCLEEKSKTFFKFNNLKLLLELPTSCEALNKFRNLAHQNEIKINLNNFCFSTGIGIRYLQSFDYVYNEKLKFKNKKKKKKTLNEIVGINSIFPIEKLQKFIFTKKDYFHITKLPTIFQKLERIFLAYDLTQNFQINNIAPIYPSFKDFLEASNSQATGEYSNYENLETLGDSVIKLICSLYLYFKFPQGSEGFLEKKRVKLLYNENLYLLAEKAEIAKFILSNELSIKNWQNPFLNRKLFKVQQQITKKSLADVIEALTGACSLGKDNFLEALRFLRFVKIFDEDLLKEENHVIAFRNLSEKDKQIGIGKDNYLKRGFEGINNCNFIKKFNYSNEKHKNQLISNIDDEENINKNHSEEKIMEKLMNKLNVINTIKFGYNFYGTESSFNQIKSEFVTIENASDFNKMNEKRIKHFNDILISYEEFLYYSNLINKESTFLDIFEINKTKFTRAEKDISFYFQENAEKIFKNKLNNHSKNVISVAESKTKQEILNKIDNSEYKENLNNSREIKLNNDKINNNTEIIYSKYDKSHLNLNDDINFQALQKEILQYKFDNLEILREALTHKSSKKYKENYERLEFLGDAILEIFTIINIFSICKKDKILEKKLNSGIITNIKSFLVSNKNLANLSIILNIDKYLILSDKSIFETIAIYKNNLDLNYKINNYQELIFQSPKIVSDILEAIIGAIFIDSGITESFLFLKRLFTPLICFCCCNLENIKFSIVNDFVEFVNHHFREKVIFEKMTINNNNKKIKKKKSESQEKHESDIENESDITINNDTNRNLVKIQISFRGKVYHSAIASTESVAKEIVCREAYAMLKDEISRKDY